MATQKQRKAVDKMVENGGIVSRAMIDAGFSPATARSPQKLTESKGYRQILEENGLTEDLISKALVEDIKNKPGKRAIELSLGADIVGMKKKEQTTTNVLVVNTHDPKAIKIAKEFEEKLKETLNNAE